MDAAGYCAGVHHGLLRRDVWFPHHDLCSTSCFVQPPQYVFGNAGRSTLVGLGAKQFDASLFRNIMLGRDGRRSLRLRGEISNVTNTPQFNSPNASIGAVAAGTISSASSPPSFQRTSRQLQTAAKLLF
jgi:hypothetical protein